MSRYVIDASVPVEYLLRTPLGLTVANMIESASLVAPEMLDAEVLSVLRRAVLNGHLEETRAQMVVDDLLRWPVEPHLSPLPGSIGLAVPPEHQSLRRLLRRCCPCRGPSSHYCRWEAVTSIGPWRHGPPCSHGVIA